MSYIEAVEVRLVPRIKIEAVEWDEANEVHATRHGVSVSEVEAVLTGPTVAYRNRKGRAGDYFVRRSTPGGRVVFVAFEYRRGTYTARPITAWEVS